MTVARKSDIMTVEYPKTYECDCGRLSELTHKNVSTRYNGKEILIKDVPSYECAAQHVKFARITRVKMKALLKEAYNLNTDEIKFK
ncbi:hypothetical protein [Rossellomorea marisflavi]|uniref:hypothetical protein n=1 Tax=Rossellomorea marisflavi TaxID=189381 RepID=UPI003459A39E